MDLMGDVPLLSQDPLLIWFLLWRSAAISLPMEEIRMCPAAVHATLKLESHTINPILFYGQINAGVKYSRAVS